MMNTYCIEYEVADALTEIGDTILSLKEESMVSGQTRCRCRIVPVGKRTLIATEVMVSRSPPSESWMTVRFGASERLLRSMFGMITGGFERDGVMVIDLGYLKENS
jgi:hypothetical protein